MTPDEILAEWKATYAELFAAHTRDPDRMRYDDATFAAVVMLTRKIDRVLKTRVIEPAFAEGYEPTQTAKPTGGGRARSD